MTKIKKKTKSGRLFALIVSIICFALCISLADLFSTAIMAGNFSGIFSSSSKITSYNIYAISTSQSSILVSAEESASSIKSQNGAGYIYNENSVYYVLASAYEKENDAELVKSNLEESGLSPFIITISVPEISITSNLTSIEKNALISAINIFKIAYQELYDISVSLDTSLKNETECKLSLNDLSSKINKIKTSFEASFNSKLTNDILNIKLKLENLNNLITQLIEYTSTNSIPFSSKIKYNYIECLILNKNLCNDIKNQI